MEGGWAVNWSAYNIEWKRKTKGDIVTRALLRYMCDLERWSRGGVTTRFQAVKYTAGTVYITSESHDMSGV